MQGLSPEQIKIMQVFHPFAYGRMTQMAERQGRFVHYTSAAVAVSIIREGAVWMRKSSTMNDFMEVEYGLECLAAALESQSGIALRNDLERVFPGSWSDVVQLLESWRPHLKWDTFLTCLSEHLDEEDGLGRLSLWRAYGGSTGVALVLNGEVFLRPSDALKAYTSPVAYLTKDRFVQEFSLVAKLIQENAEFVASIGRDLAVGQVFEMLRSAALCTKHPGFSEEREWRVIYSPSAQSERLVRSIEVIAGTPQPVYKIPLKNVPDMGLTGIEIPELLDHLIIGPTRDPQAMAEAFVELLAGAGVPNAEQRVRASDIPLR